MKTEADLQKAADGGLLAEGHYLDIKRQLEPGPKANRELARDLASFAIDGGELVIGVDEDTSPPTLTPLPLAGLAERVEQIGLAAVDEPVNIRTQVIMAAAGSGEGYLIVNVPPSARAPHMAGNVFYGRNDMTKYPLSAPEVARLHERRKQWEVDSLDVLDAFIKNDPTDADHKTLAHLFVIAEPVAANPELLVPVLNGDDWGKQLREIVTRPLDRKVAGFAPDWDYLNRTTRRAGGAAWVSEGFEPDGRASPTSSEQYLLEVGLLDGGGVRVFCGRGSDTRAAPYGGAGLSPQLIFEVLIIGWTYRAAGVARTISRATGFTGMWDIAVGLTELRGAYSWATSEGMIIGKPAYSAPDYRQSTRATLAELEESPNLVVDRLLGRLLRALGSRQWKEIDDLLSGPQAAP